MRRPIVAIAGRPNVGKSTLFNWLVRKNRAIVGPDSGITRDRIYGKWYVDEDCIVDLVDTGGFATLKESSITQSILLQTMQAIHDADVILCVLDAASGPTSDDAILVDTLRKSDSQVIYVANKVDDDSTSLKVGALYELGIDSIVEISARNRKGLSEIITALKKYIHLPGVGDEEASGIRITILGRPNVGKSLLINRIIGEERSIVSPEPGTTRDYVDTKITKSGRDYVFVDTAGIRRKSRIDSEIEKTGSLRSLRNIDMSHVCLYLIDATEGITEQDKRLVGLALDHGRATLVVANKCDLIPLAQEGNLREEIRYRLRFIPDVNVMCISALTGENINKIYPMIDDLFDKTMAQVSTPRLNRIISDIVKASPPPAYKGRHIRFYYVTQVDVLPPRFRIYTNYPEAIPPSYTRYIATSIKKICQMEGIPVAVQFARRIRRERTKGSR